MSVIEFRHSWLCQADRYPSLVEVWLMFTQQLVSRRASLHLVPVLTAAHPSRLSHYKSTNSRECNPIVQNQHAVTSQTFCMKASIVIAMVEQ